MGAMLILDLQDRFAQNRGLSGAYPRSIGTFRFLLMAHTDSATQVSAPLPTPLEMRMTINPSGFFLFFGTVMARDGSPRRLEARGWPWTIRIVSEYYQSIEVTPPAVPDSFVPGMSGRGCSVPIPIPLDPGAAYPFPNERPGLRGGRLRGTLRNADGSPISRVQVEALDAANQSLSDVAVTADDGQWVLVLSTLPHAGLVTVRFTFADGITKDVRDVQVAADRENNLAQTAFCGQVRMHNIGVRNALIRVDKVKGIQSLSDATGNWFLYLGLLQSGDKVTVTAKLPDRPSTKSISTTVHPRATVVVPTFDF